MEFDRYFVIMLRKGPNWTSEPTPELEMLQTSHLAHLSHLKEIGLLTVAGPVEAHPASDLRGISIFRYDAFESLEDLQALVDQDPMFQVGHLVADYMKWYVPKGATLQASSAGEKH